MRHEFTHANPENCNHSCTLCIMCSWVVMIQFRALNGLTSAYQCAYYLHVRRTSIKHCSIHAV